MGGSGDRQVGGEMLPLQLQDKRKGEVATWIIEFIQVVLSRICSIFWRANFQSFILTLQSSTVFNYVY